MTFHKTEEIKIKLSDVQTRIKKFEFDGNYIMVKGVSGSGKTTSAIERYKYMIEKEKIKSENILVLLLNRIQAFEWRSKLILKGSGALNITSYFGFIQNQVNKYWPLILENCKEVNQKVINPVFMTFESSQCLMHKLMEHYREKRDLLAGLNSPSERVAMDLNSNLLKAAVSDIPFDEIGERLYNSLEYKDLVKKMIFQDMNTIIGFYVKRCLEEGVLDYALSVYLYNNYLLNNEEYNYYLTRNIKHLIVDNVEEIVPSQVDFIKTLLPNTDTSLLLYNPEGGYGTIYGANPQYIRDNLLGKYREVNIEGCYTSKKVIFNLGDILEKNILYEENEKYDCGQSVEVEVITELRSDMIEKTVSKVCQLIEQGMEPKDIAVISPFIDVSLEYVLNNELEQRGYNAVNFGRKKRMIDNQFVHALIVLSCLAHDFSDIILNKDDVRIALALILDLDLVRASLLTSRVFRSRKGKTELVDLKDVRVIERIGYDYLEKYQQLKNWLEQYKSETPATIDEFFRRVYLELLINIPAANENLQICKQLIDSAESFIKVMSYFKTINNPNLEFVQVIKDGVKAAESIFDIEEKFSGNNVILATPMAFLASGKSVKVQIWTDLSSEMWMPRNIKDTENPYVITKTWHKNEIYTEEIESENQKKKLATLVQCTLKKCKEKVYLFDSRYSASGYEQEGYLSEVFLNTVNGERA
ncbi:MAG: UvrD/REP helicase [Clostridiales bacterium]|nr:UvrD/REP helicase [Clostridiales bacterium]